MGTIRHQMIEQLKYAAMDLPALARRLGVKEKELVAHLPHVAKTVCAAGDYFSVEPAVCRHCGYTFTDRRRLSPPSRCPSCKGNGVDGPWYAVRVRGPTPG